MKYPRLTSVLLFVVFTLCFFVQVNSYMNWDCSWLLRCTEKMLHGGRYYYDFIETNPPLMIWLGFPVIGFHALTGLSVSFSFKAYYIAIALLSLGTSFELLKRIFRHTVYVDVSIVALAWVFLIMSSTVFGERECFSLLFTMPYFFLRAAELSGEKLSIKMRCWVVLFSACGFLLKPYFLLPLVLVEFYRAVKLKRVQALFNVELLSLFFLGLLYLWLIAIFTPSYYTKILPLVIALYLPFWHANVWQLLMQNACFAWIIILIFALVLWRKLPYRECFAVMILAAVGYLWGSYFIQDKPWFYHIYPAAGVSSYMIILIFTQAFLRFKADQYSLGKNLKNSLILIMSGLLIASAVGASSFRVTYTSLYLALSKESIYPYIVNIPKHFQLKPGPVLIMNNNIGLSELLFRYNPGFYSALKTPSLLFIPAIGYAEFHHETLTPRQERWARRIKNIFFDDLNRTKPQAIIVYDTKAPEKYFMTHSKRYQAFLKNYHQPINYHGFRVYLRKHSQAE